ncbi:anti-CBASS protein Acb1 family protein [Halococcus saccharolyticus]|uniref:Phage protein n=1 Tax=Halococcus saccharolyticus DSM 5350 TaxID=1227455 RepID=M0MQM9_9EURY|nr:anti-CBASS Acb1 family protein [Halococcus saccharolyticus]EMA48007.1 phage protein [Halococcus saccharolyticus DSM 5350]
MSSDSDDESEPQVWRGPDLPQARTNAMYGGRSGVLSRSNFDGLLDDARSPKMWDALGYPRENQLTFNTWLTYYLRGGPVSGLLDKFVNDAWQGRPDIVDDEPTEGDDEDDQTDFETAVENLFDNNAPNNPRRTLLREALKPRLMAADLLARLGQYSVIVVGIKDDQSVSEKLDSDDSRDLSDLAYIELYPQNKIDFTVSKDLDDDRYGRPDSYTITDANTETSDVHHTRVIHIASNTLVDPYRSIPFYKNIINRITDMTKIYGASGEGYWRGGYQGIVMKPPEAIKEIGGTTQRVPTEFQDGGDALATQISNYVDRFDRTIRSNGEIETLGADIASPADHMDIQWEAIAAAKDIPQSIIKGNETGERATTEDNADWRSSVAGDRDSYLEARILRPLLDLLIRAGILPEPDGETYTIEWPALSELSEQEEAEIMERKANAINTATGKNPQQDTTTAERRKQIYDWSPERGSEAPDHVEAQDERSPGELDAAINLDAEAEAASEGTASPATAPSGMAGTVRANADEPDGKWRDTSDDTTDDEEE